MIKCPYKCICVNRRKIVHVKQGDKIRFFEEYDNNDPCSRCKDGSECIVDQVRLVYLNAGYYDNITDVEKVKEFLGTIELKKFLEECKEFEAKYGESELED